MINSTVTFAKQHTPNSVRVIARRVMCDAHNARLKYTVPVSSRSEYDNVYHCAMRKTASQWIKAMLSDPVVYRNSGLLPYDPRPYKWKHPEPFPSGRVVSTLFLPYKKFMAVAKPERHRTFFVLRDPRDMVVSSYFSTRNSHTPMGDVPEVRKVLLEKSFKEGLLYVISNLNRKGTFKALRSWATAPDAEAIRLFRYEDLTGAHQAEEVNQLLRHCGIVLAPSELADLLARYSFSRMRSDRAAATATAAHYRKGKAGDWRNHFDDDVQEAFDTATGDLVDLLGYPK